MLLRPLESYLCNYVSTGVSSRSLKAPDIEPTPTGKLSRPPYSVHRSKTRPRSDVPSFGGPRICPEWSFACAAVRLFHIGRTSLYHTHIEWPIRRLNNLGYILPTVGVSHAFGGHRAVSLVADGQLGAKSMLMRCSRRLCRVS